MPTPLYALLTAALLVAPLRADRVITDDGRIITPKKARAEGDGYRLTFEAGEILLATKDGIKAIEIEGDMSDYVPKDDNEKKKLADGYIRYRSRWYSKKAFETQLKKEHAISKARTDEMALHSEWKNGWLRETKHFLFQTNTSEEWLEYYSDLLEAYYALMNKQIGIKPTLSYRRKKMKVNIYKTYEEFLKISNEAGAGISPGVIGYFWAHDDTLNFFHNYSDPMQATWVGLHECTHLLTFLIDQQYEAQIWLNEAVADYFGSSEVNISKRGKIELKPGMLQTDRVLTVQEAMKEGKHVELEDLFKITRSKFGAFEYAHAWSFVYFLNKFDDGKYSKGFAKFFRELYTRFKGIEYKQIPGPPPTGTAFKASPAEIRSHLLKRIGEKDTVELELDWKRFIQAIPIDGPEALLKRGMRAISKGKYAQALPDLDKAIEGGITDARAYASRGAAQAAGGSSDAGVADFKKAIELDPLSASYRYRLSQLLCGRTFGAISSGRFRIVFQDDDETYDNPEAKTQAGLAAELDPENDAYSRWYERFE
jgi:tetratricopeptide (TPR) repeat protein